MKFQTIVSTIVLLVVAAQCDPVIIEEELGIFLGTLETYSLTPNAVVFVVDESGSIGAETYQAVKLFTQLIARRFSVSPEHSRIAIVSFANVTKTHSNYIQDVDGNNMCTLLKVIKNMDYAAAYTHTSLGMALARDILAQARPNANKAVGSLVVRASDSRPEGLGSMLDVTKYPPSAHGFTCRNCGGGDRGRVAIYRPFGEVSLSLNRTVTCMVLKANDRRTSCPCHDEFRGPRSDYVRQDDVKDGFAREDEHIFRLSTEKGSSTREISKYFIKNGITRLDLHILNTFMKIKKTPKSVSSTKQHEGYW
ncbi:sushi, von Willebrand factor type A, EGF and pentraxin domain-containing protein 1 [Trichonephila clavipes]|uniref:Sushi, von Willebrand factor type A, EGF and pentraxin domain-containing protein 1 n=1 Tax=Trichonephila clavipes TaxID=2585209 RepID=A0A8X6V093_TRICX|nr:sushi, von Willebrand factor type A, EGF and pentraxin domain-containing protein 1 [Trichonephila clavipes]